MVREGGARGGVAQAPAASYCSERHRQDNGIERCASRCRPPTPQPSPEIRRDFPPRNLRSVANGHTRAAVYRYVSSDPLDTRQDDEPRPAMTQRPNQGARNEHVASNADRLSSARPRCKHAAPLISSTASPSLQAWRCVSIRLGGICLLIRSLHPWGTTKVSFRKKPRDRFRTDYLPFDPADSRLYCALSTRG